MSKENRKAMFVGGCSALAMMCVAFATQTITENLTVTGREIMVAHPTEESWLKLRGDSTGDGGGRLRLEMPGRNWDCYDIDAYDDDLRVFAVSADDLELHVRNFGDGELDAYFHSAIVAELGLYLGTSLSDGFIHGSNGDVIVQLGQ